MLTLLLIIVVGYLFALGMQRKQAEEILELKRVIIEKDEEIRKLK